MVHVADIDSFYSLVQSTGKLRARTHAERWSTAVLKTLSLNLDRATKRKLAKALPPELGSVLSRMFWLLHFRNKQISANEFLGQVARRSGNTDIKFARYPTTAVFGGIKQLIDDELNEEIIQSLAPEISEMWQQA